MRRFCLLLMLFLVGCGQPDFVDSTPTVTTGGATTTETALDQPFDLSVGQTITLATANMQISFEQMQNDSRCPQDVACFWAGNAEVVFTVSGAASEPLSITLNTGLEPRAATYDQFTITLLDLRPDPITTTPIDPTAYMATLKVQRTADLPAATIEPSAPSPTATASASTGSAQVGVPFDLPMGQAVQFTDPALTVRFGSVLNDSRCPQNVETLRVECSWQGNAEIEILVDTLGHTPPGDAPMSLRLNTALEPTSQTYGDYTFTLLGLGPHPVIYNDGHVEIPGPYVARLLVEPLTETVAEAQIIVTDTYTGAIFPAQLSSTYSQVLNETHFWTPDEMYVQELEAQLPAYLLAADDPRATTIAEQLPSYTRQYIGISDGQQQRFIYVNAFCNAVGIDWQHELVQVLDGGACFFQLRYDVDLRRFMDLSINGEA